MSGRTRTMAVLFWASFAAVPALAENANPHRVRAAAPSKTLGETLTGDAKRDYEAAMLLYRSGDFRSAALKFESAFNGSGDVRLLWNQAASEQSAHRYARAVALVTRYLASESPLITREAARKAHAFLEAALPLTARLFIDSKQEGLEVWIDDQFVGRTPLPPDTRVDLGTHRLRVRKPDFVEQTGTLSVKNPSDLHVQVTLSPVVQEGRLIVRAGKGDTITLDGHFAAVGTYDDTVQAGPHRIRVTAPDKRPFESRIHVLANRTRVAHVKLDPEPRAVPTWVWFGGAGLLAAGAGVAGYFLLKPESPKYVDTISGGRP